jgi:hypothetical protein
MSPGNGDAQIRLDGRLSEDQLRIAHEAVMGQLIGRTGDLRLLDKNPEPERELAELAALSRLASVLEVGRIDGPDPIAQRVAAGLADAAGEIVEYEEHRERYEEGVAEREALRALAEIFPGDTGVEGEEEPPPTSTYSVPNDLTDRHREIVLAEVDAALNGRAMDLKHLGKHPDPDEAVAEVAALARLSADLNVATFELPDPEAQAAFTRLLAETEDHIGYDQVREKHEAWQAAARLLSTPPPAPSSEEDQ